MLNYTREMLNISNNRFLKIIIASLAIIFCSFSGYAQVTFEAVSSGQSTGTSLTFSHNRGNGFSTVTLVSVQLGRQTTISSATYGGNSMTLVGTSSISSLSGVRNTVLIYRIINAPTGNQNVVINVSGSNGIVAGAISYSQVNTTTPLGTFRSSNGSSTSASVGSIPTTSGAAVFSAISHAHNSTPSLGSGQVSRWQRISNSSTDRAKGTASTKVISSGTSTSVSYTMGGSDRWAAAAVSINPIVCGTLTASVTKSDIPCLGINNGSITITSPSGGSGSYEYRLNGGSWQSSGSFTNLSEGIYTVEIRDQNSPQCTNNLGNQTINETEEVTDPQFDLGDLSQKCLGAETITYTATADNATGISYSLDATSLAGNNSINSSTGAVTYNSSWGDSTFITVTVTGCNGPKTATHRVAVDTIIANVDSITVLQGVPQIFNVLDNDLCNIDSSSLTIVQQPSGGFVQLGTNGEMNYTSFGNFLGEDEFTYQICSNTPVACRQAKVIIDVNEVIDDPCFIASRPKNYYLPFPENNTQLRQSLLSAASSDLLTDSARSIISLSIMYPGTIITYDHWEDGYETDITVPQQVTTQIWGDGDSTNGYLPGFPGDIIPAGSIITLDNTFAWNRNTSTIVYDGKDRIYTNTNISVSKVSGDGGFFNAIRLFDVQNVKTNVQDDSRFGEFFILPFGEDVDTGISKLPTSSNSTGVFRYVGLFVRASEDGTIVQLDLDGDGTIDTVSPMLNRGEVWFYNGVGGTPGISANTNNALDLKKGARIIANRPVGVDLVFGGLDTYGTRNIPVLPSQFYGSEYLSPVYSTDDVAPVVAYFVNPNPSPITINWTRGVGSPSSGSFTIPANNGINFFDMDVASGYKFESDGGETYTAVTIIDADSAGSAYDWSFNMIPINKLTSFGNIAWAPGSSDFSANYNPIWVSPTANTTVYIKYDGNVTDGPNQSPCGAYYDSSFTLNALNSALVYGLNNDNSGMALFNCDETPMALVWGQRPFGGTSVATPAIDVGYIIEPKCIEKLIFANDDRRITTPMKPVNINVAVNDFAFLTLLDSVSSSILEEPKNGIAVVNPDGSITYTPNPGFTGEDTLVYRICAETPDNLICDVASVFISVYPIYIEGQNTICGGVFGDYNPNNGLLDLGEEGIGGITVELFEDVNKNGLLDAPDTLVQTVISSTIDDIGYIQFDITQNNTIIDSFKTDGSPSGNDGTLNWAGDWEAINGGANFDTGTVRIEGNLLQVRNRNRTAYRTVDLSNSSTTALPILSFEYQGQNLNNETNRRVFVDVGSSTSGPWTQVLDFNNNVLTAFSVNIPANRISSTTTIRFRTNDHSAMENSNRRGLFSNVSVEYFTDNDYIVKLEQPISDGWLHTTSPEYYSFSFEGINNVECGNVFGLNKYPIPDINSTFVNVEVSGDVSTNDKVGPNTLYGTNPVLTSSPANSIASITMNDDGTYIFEADSPGIYIYDVEVCAPTTSTPCPTETLTITVLDFNSTQPMIIANPDYGITLQNTPVTLKSLENDHSLSKFIDLDSTSVSLISGTEPNPTTEGSLSVNATTGYITFTPVASFTGVVTYQYEVCDKNTPPLCATTTQEIIVMPTGTQNTTYAMDDYNYISQKDSAAKGNVLDNDFDLEGHNQTIIAQDTIITDVGRFILNTDGTYVFVPEDGFTGSVNFPYSVCDDGQPQACAQATLYILVYPDNKIVPVVDYNTTYINMAVPGNVLTNDIDPEGDAITLTMIGSINVGGSPVTVNTAEGGSIEIDSTGKYTYTPPLDFVGRDSIVYTACDDGNPQACGSTTLYIDVLPMPQPSDPTFNTTVANPDQGVSYGEPISIKLLANDIDPEGDEQIFQGIKNPNNGQLITTGTINTIPGIDEDGNEVANAGSLTVNADGTVTFTPTEGFQGIINTLQYEVCDTVSSPNTACAESTLDIQVLEDPLGIDKPPFAGDDYAIARFMNRPIVGNWLSNDSDPDVDTLDDRITVNGKSIIINPDSPTGTGQPIDTLTTEEGGTVIMLDVGTFIYNPPTDFMGPDQVVYEICDTVAPIQCDKATIYLFNQGLLTNFGDLSGIDTMGSIFIDFNGDGKPDGDYALWLGETILPRTDSTTNSDASFDQGDDGLIIPSQLDSTMNNIYRAVISSNEAGVTAYVRLMIDWNDDKQFDDVYTLSITTTQGGSDTLDFSVLLPPGLGAATVNYRIMVSNDSTDFSKQMMNNGEVEDYQFGHPQPVPVSLINFGAIWQDSDGYVHWTTAMELNNSHFELFRSFDHKTYEPIGVVESKALYGNSNELLHYTYLDTEVSKWIQNNVYYKLVQHDFDGTTETFGPAVLTIDLNKISNTIDVYPNPARSFVNYVIKNTANADVTISVTSAMGQTIYQNVIRPNAEITSGVIDVSSWSNGIYYIQFIQNGVIKRTEKISVIN
jgi:hypothetical protein